MAWFPCTCITQSAPPGGHLSGERSPGHLGEGRKEGSGMGSRGVGRGGAELLVQEGTLPLLTTGPQPQRSREPWS